jgi:hypothetical protein
MSRTPDSARERVGVLLSLAPLNRRPVGLGPEGSGPRLGTPKHPGGVRLSWRAFG